MLSPGILVVVQSFPERGQSPLNLRCVSMDVRRALRTTYLQLAHCGLAEVLGAGVDTESDQETAVDALLAQTLFSLLRPDDALLLQLAGLALSLGLPSRFQRRVALDRLGSADPEEGDVGSAASATPRAVHTTPRPLVHRSYGSGRGGRGRGVGARPPRMASHRCLRFFRLAVAHVVEEE